MAVLLSLMVLGLRAQIICLDSEEAATRMATDPEEIPFIPILGVTYDQYVPVTSGLLTLCCLGGAFLLTKRIHHNSTIKQQKSRYESTRQNQAF